MSIRAMAPRGTGVLRALAAMLLAVGAAGAAGVDWDGEDGGLGGFDLEKELGGGKSDLDLLRLSHLSEVAHWQYVQPAGRVKEGEAPGGPFHWKAGAADAVKRRTLASPVSDGPARALVAIPEKHLYRVWLGYMGEPGKPHPVTLTVGGAGGRSHAFGAKGLTGEPGADQEKAMPIRFEDELQRISAPRGRVPVWEYVDLELEAGPAELQLTSPDRKAEVDAVLITASRSFRPSRSHLEGEGTLGRTYVRVRVAESAAPASSYTVGGAGLGYHWRRIYQGETEPRWRGSLGSKDPQGFKGAGEGAAASIAVGEWSRWVDATEEIQDGTWARGGGPWATGQFGFGGVAEGRAEVQLAWYSHDGAVLGTVRPGIAEGSAICIVPLDPDAGAPAGGGTNAVWGMRDPETLARFESAEDVDARHFQWGREALAELGVKEGHPLPRLVTLYTSCGPAPSARKTAQRMLASLGLNSFGVSDPAMLAELKQEYRPFIAANDSQYLCDTHDPAEPAVEANAEQTLRKRAESIMAGRPAGEPPLVTIKMGDEIGAVAGAVKINGLASCRRAFHDYLQKELKDAGRDASFLGVESVDELDYIDALPPAAGAYQRRLFAYCARFKFELTALYYGQLTRAAGKAFPRVQTYCNFSPHPPMFGQQMNGSDWFQLTRRGGASMAWGEDWAGRNGGWGFTGFDVVSYYAAWVACAARRGGGLPAGFYVVCSMGGADTKLFSLLPRGIFEAALYAWGPMYMGAEGSNFWSERRETYKEVARGAYALGPADEIVYRGRREPAKVALLYNRSHEIWNGSFGGIQTDRLLTFTALMHAHLPVDIVLEEDLTDEGLKPYRVLYLQGFNLDPRHVAAVARWVEAGGVAVGWAGTGIRDAFDEPASDCEALFGARQRLAGASKGNWHPQSLPEHEPIDALELAASELTPAVKAEVIGVKAVLTPTTGKSVGTFKDGSCAAVVREAGKGRTLLLGVTPGHMYKGRAAGGSRYTLELRPLLTLPAERTAGPGLVSYSEPQTETCLFEHESGLAVTLNNFAFFLEPAKDRPCVLTVRTGRKVSEAVSSLRGPLEWSQDAGAVTVKVPSPETVDIVILR